MGGCGVRVAAGQTRGCFPGARPAYTTSLSYCYTQPHAAPRSQSGGGGGGQRLGSRGVDAVVKGEVDGARSRETSMHVVANVHRRPGLVRPRVAGHRTHTDQLRLREAHPPRGKLLKDLKHLARSKRNLPSSTAPAEPPIRDPSSPPAAPLPLLSLAQRVPPLLPARPLLPRKGWASKSSLPVSGAVFGVL